MSGMAIFVLSLAVLLAIATGGEPINAHSTAAVSR